MKRDAPPPCAAGRSGAREGIEPGWLKRFWAPKAKEEAGMGAPLRNWGEGELLIS